MRLFMAITLLIAAFSAVQSLEAQPPGERGRGGRPSNGGPPDREPQGGRGDSSALIEKMLSLDANGDRILTIAEVNDLRLEALLKRADKNSDGNITVEELTVLFTVEAAQGRSNPRGGAEGNSGGQGREGYGGPVGPPGFGGPGRGMRRPGEILPPFMQDELQLTEAQRLEITALQTDVDARLKKILNEDQLQRLSQPPGPPQGRGPGQSGPSGPSGANSGRNGNRPPQE